MHEQFPTPAAEPPREVIQPPDVLFEALLVSRTGARIPVSNQTTLIHLFEDNTASYVEIIDMAQRKRIFTEDALMLEALSEIGCLTMNYLNWDASHESYPSRVSEVGNWEVFDVKGEVSLMEELRRYGRVVTRPEASAPDDTLFHVKRRSPVVSLETDSGPIEMHYFNTTVFAYEENPEMNHIMVKIQQDGGRVLNLRIFDEDQLAASLLKKRFTMTSSVFPDAEVIEVYIAYQQQDFNNQAEELLAPKPEEEG